jgi:hypothetical protein
MGIVVNTEPFPGIAMDAPLVGGAVEMVPSRPIEPDCGAGFAAKTD